MYVWSLRLTHDQPGGYYLMEVPETVLESMKKVQESGLTNMIDRVTVIELVRDLIPDPESAQWLKDHRKEYGELLLGPFAEYCRKVENHESTG